LPPGPWISGGYRSDNPDLLGLADRLGPVPALLRVPYGVLPPQYRNRSPRRSLCGDRAARTVLQAASILSRSRHTQGDGQSHNHRCGHNSLHARDSIKRPYRQPTAHNAQTNGGLRTAQPAGFASRNPQRPLPPEPDPPPSLVPPVGGERFGFVASC
jgi:hypothetical protein